MGRTPKNPMTEEQFAEYLEKQKEQARENQRRWAAKNREKERQRAKKNYGEKGDTIKAQQKAKREARKKAEAELAEISKLLDSLNIPPAKPTATFPTLDRIILHLQHA